MHDWLCLDPGWLLPRSNNNVEQLITTTICNGASTCQAIKAQLLLPQSLTFHMPGDLNLFEREDRNCPLVRYTTAVNRDRFLWDTWGRVIPEVPFELPSTSSDTPAEDSYAESSDSHGDGTTRADAAESRAQVRRSGCIVCDARSATMQHDPPSVVFTCKPYLNQ